MKEITIWERYKKDDKDNWYWEHNHISDGYDSNIAIPEGINKAQTNNWKNAQWRSFKGFLDDKYVVTVAG